MLLNRLNALDNLDISNTDITDEGLASISLKLGLEKLFLTNCLNFTEIGLNFVLTKCTNLTQMDLKNTRISRTFFDTINRLEDCNIQLMNLSSCRHFTRANLKLRYLQELNMSSCSNLQTVSLECESLRILNLSSNNIIHTLTLRCPSVTNVNLSNCVSLRNIDGNLPRLEEINLYNCRNISVDALVEFLGASFESLSKLSLKGLIQVDDHSIFSIVDPCSKLTYLDISGCKNLSSNLKRILAQRKRFDVITK